MGNHALGTEPLIVIVCSALAMYNAIELFGLIFIVFKQWKSLYFKSLLVATFGILPYNVGFLVYYFNLTYHWTGFAFSTWGWVFMVTGQSFVLYSRLNLVVLDEKVLRFVFWMIIIDAIIFHVPTTVLLFGSHLKGVHPGFKTGYQVYEKIQMTGFCIQEFIISGIYVRETARILKTLSQGGNTRRLIRSLLAINIMVILMDLGLLAVEYHNLSVLEQTFKGVIYSVKLKCEFAILGKLVKVARGSVQAEASHERGPFQCATLPQTFTSVTSPKGMPEGSQTQGFGRFSKGVVQHVE